MFKCFIGKKYVFDRNYFFVWANNNKFYIKNPNSKVFYLLIKQKKMTHINYGFFHSFLFRWPFLISNWLTWIIQYGILNNFHFPNANISKMYPFGWISGLNLNHVSFILVSINTGINVKPVERFLTIISCSKINPVFEKKI